MYTNLQILSLVFLSQQVGFELGISFYNFFLRCYLVLKRTDLFTGYSLLPLLCQQPTQMFL